MFKIEENTYVLEEPTKEKLGKLDSYSPGTKIEPSNDIDRNDFDFCKKQMLNDKCGIQRIAKKETCPNLGKGGRCSPELRAKYFCPFI